ncbi:class I SAM-dependent methyltransferase [Azospirillum aestuarii]|uniref:class I SAM-dependent methyltransferase n=1 Tax=Azospirillum aestuarii TaxID=2802052 RepID=UPI004054B857
MIAGAGTVGKRLIDGPYVEEAMALIKRLEPDSYSEFLVDFLTQGRRRFGSNWMYADIVTVLLGLCDILQPATYLEIGVRRGRSLCAVAAKHPECRLIGFDLWVDGYAGMPNPGPDFVRAELRKVGHTGTVDLIDGDSHRTVAAYLSERPELTLDLITVDGDHSVEGAFADLCDTVPRLAVGGALVLDDIAHPDLPDLRTLWNDVIVSDPRFSTWGYTEVGYGVGFALRRY